MDKVITSMIEHVSKSAKLLSDREPLTMGASPPAKGGSVAISWSGGKDSCLLLHIAREEGLDVRFIFNLIDNERKMGISPPFNPTLAELQSEALGIPIIKVDVTENPRKQFFEFAHELRKSGIDSIGMGYYDYMGQRDFVHRVALDSELSVFEPLVRANQESSMFRALEYGIRPVIVSTRLDSVDNSWLGREVSDDFMGYLKRTRGIDFCGEKGEFHTFVIDSPLFRKRISIDKHISIRTDEYSHMYITMASLKGKECDV